MTRSCLAMDTAWGVCTVEYSDAGLARVRLPEPGRRAADAETTVAPPQDAIRCASLISTYFEGKRVEFSDIPLDMSRLTPAQQAIYAALRLVPYGETTTYGELAARIGQPGAARAVGMAMARNPWPLVVPCHRVLAKGGALHGFSAPGGLDTKRRMLVMEGVDLDRGEPMLPGLF